MKYWAHINNEVKGPFEAAALGAAAGFTLATLIVPDGAAQGAPWKEAASYPEVLAALKPAPAAEPAQAPAPEKAAPPAEDKLMLTMRGSLIDPEISAALQKAAAAPKPVTVTSGVLPPPAQAAPAAAPVPAPARAEELRDGLDRLAAELAAVSRAQADLAARLEAAARELKALRG